MIPGRWCASFSACILVVGVAASLTAAVARAASINPEHDPFAPAADRLAARFAAVDREIARLQSTGDAAAAQAMSARLQHFEDEFGGTAQSDLTSPALDVVSIYEGTLGSSGNPPPTSSGTIHVEATDRPVVLTIGSYSPTQWTLQLDAGAKLQKVFLYGIYPPTLVAAQHGAG
jgi:hypothetical protein